MTYLIILGFIQACSFLLGLLLINLNKDLADNLILIAIGLSLTMILINIIEIIKFFY